jgi:hypothetical protein
MPSKAIATGPEGPLRNKTAEGRITSFPPSMFFQEGKFFQEGMFGKF